MLRPTSFEISPSDILKYSCKWLSWALYVFEHNEDKDSLLYCANLAKNIFSNVGTDDAYKMLALSSLTYLRIWGLLDEDGEVAEYDYYNNLIEYYNTILGYNHNTRRTLTLLETQLDALQDFVEEYPDLHAESKALEEELEVLLSL